MGDVIHMRDHVPPEWLEASEVRMQRLAECQRWLDEDRNLVRKYTVNDVLMDRVKPMRTLGLYYANRFYYHHLQRVGWLVAADDGEHGEWAFAEHVPVSNYFPLWDTQNPLRSHHVKK